MQRKIGRNIGDEETGREMTESNRKFSTVGLIGRFKPLHNGAALMLDAVCDQAEEVKIGIGSSNKYNLRNPFTVEETEGMIRAYLSPRHGNFKIIHVPDFAHVPDYADGQQWRRYVKDHFGTLDAFVSGNDYVRNLLREDYTIINPANLIAAEKYLRMRATEVRLEMARSGSWRNLIPQEVAAYLTENNLVERFYKEFGTQALAQVAAEDQTYKKIETEEEERKHTLEK